MAKAPIKIMGMRVGQIDGRDMLIFQGKDGIGRPMEMCVPTNGWDIIHEEGRKQIASAFNLANPTDPDRWVPSVHPDGAPFQLGTTENGKVALIARQGLPGEVRLSLDRNTALELSQALREQALVTPEDRSKH